MAVKSFTRGSSTFICRCCGRNTRATRDRSEGDIELCAQCYELAGWENTLSDMGEEELDLVSITSEFTDLLKKGVTEAKLEKTFPDLWKLAMTDEPDALMIDKDGELIRESELSRSNAKYVYPEGMSAADKKKFRAAARRKA